MVGVNYLGQLPPSPRGIESRLIAPTLGSTGFGWCHFIRLRPGLDCFLWLDGAHRSAVIFVQKIGTAALTGNSRVADAAVSVGLDLQTHLVISPRLGFMVRDAQPDSAVLGKVFVALACSARRARLTRLRCKQRQRARDAARHIAQRAHEAHALARVSRPTEVRQRSPRFDLLNTMATDHLQDCPETRRLSQSGGFPSSFMKE